MLNKLKKIINRLFLIEGNKSTKSTTITESAAINNITITEPATNNICEKLEKNYNAFLDCINNFSAKTLDSIVGWRQTFLQDTMLKDNDFNYKLIFAGTFLSSIPWEVICEEYTFFNPTRTDGQYSSIKWFRPTYKEVLLYINTKTGMLITNNNCFADMEKITKGTRLTETKTMIDLIRNNKNKDIFMTNVANEPKILQYIANNDVTFSKIYVDEIDNWLNKFGEPKALDIMFNK